MAKLLVFRLRRLLDTFAVSIEEPTVIEAAQTPVFNATVGEVGAAMRTKLADQPKPVFVIAEQYQIFAHDSQRERRTVGQHFV
jgi:hypothetical protein